MVLPGSKTAGSAQSRLFPARQYLALHLPRWATDCVKRHDRRLDGLAVPLVLYERYKGALRIAELDERASHAGLYKTQSLSDARAMMPEIMVRELDRDYLQAVFADFADWHSYASPIVSVVNDMEPYGDLVLDIYGVDHLFGGQANMLAMLTSKLRGLGFGVQGAIAPSIGAAWALSHFNSGVVILGETETVLETLPVHALRLDSSQSTGLMQMGLKRIGQLYPRERKALQARFGASLLLRLDQALGRVEERPTPRIAVAERYVERRFPDPIGLIDDVLMCARDLAIQLATRLEAEAMGAQGFHLFLYRVDHKVMSLSVNAARATRDPEHIARLFSNRAERLSGEFDAGFGIDAIRLGATSVSALDSTQIAAFSGGDGAENLDRLYDRITSRLGPLAVVRSAFVNTHIPERAVRLEPVMAQTPADPLAKPNPKLQRPLRLLPSPEQIKVIAQVPDGPPARMVWRRVSYRFVKASGPERIGVEWWREAQKLKLMPDDEEKDGEKTKQKEQVREGREIYREGMGSRDYYVAEDEGGRRFWLFREGLYEVAPDPKWYLHGFFA